MCARVCVCDRESKSLCVVCVCVSVCVSECVRERERERKMCTGIAKTLSHSLSLSLSPFFSIAKKSAVAFESKSNLYLVCSSEDEVSNLKIEKKKNICELENSRKCVCEYVCVREREDRGRS